jgi:hypothetical protein
MIITGAGVLVAGTFFAVSLRARRRIPETQAWIDEQIARYNAQEPD